MLYIHGGVILTPGEELREAVVLTDGMHIAAVGPSDLVVPPSDARQLDASDLLVAPGFIDIQFNGAFGHDFTADPASIWPVASRYVEMGVTALLPTIITSPLENVARAQEIVTHPPDSFRGAMPLGLHVEGPFLNPQKKGAHNPAYLLPPSVDAVADWSPEKGVRLVTLAPELPGALEVVSMLAERGVVVSAGHSMASYEEAEAGFDAGIRYGTHLFNAMPALTHRQPGLPGALLTDERVTVGLIADGVHTHPSVIDLVWRALGSARLSLVTDAMAALGMAPGRHLLGDYEVFVDAVSARLADGTLAGSILTPVEAIRNLVAITGCRLADALAAVTTVPARLLGLQAERGRIAPGYIADLTLLTPDLHVAATIARGELVYSTLV
jgi:N-acetylglucosamine-6-phosphate deacetylase